MTASPIFQFALLLFADLLPFNTVMAVRYIQQLINQNYKNQIYSTGSCLKHMLVHSEFSICLLMLTFSIHDSFFEVLNLHCFIHSKLAGVYRFKEDYA